MNCQLIGEEIFQKHCNEIGPKWRNTVEKKTKEKKEKCILTRKWQRLLSKIQLYEGGSHVMSESFKVDEKNTLTEISNIKVSIRKESTKY